MASLIRRAPSLEFKTRQRPIGLSKLLGLSMSS
jgi:hypothetical protein